MEKKIRLVASAVIVDQNHVLLVKYNGFTLLPGGAVEHGATAVLALQQAICESWDVELTIREFLGAFEFLCDDTDRGVYHELNLLFRTESKELSYPNFPDIPDPSVFLEWCHLDLLGTADLQPARLGEALPLVLKKEGTWFTNVDLS